MKCPVCRQRTMYVVEHAGIALDVCAACEGVWFDATELDLLLGGPVPVIAAGPGAGDEAGRPCPRCRRTMAKANIAEAAGVTVDVCRDGGCGLWFDRGEVAAVRSGLEAAGRVIDPAAAAFLAEVFPELPAGDQAAPPPVRKGEPS